MKYLTFVQTIKHLTVDECCVALRMIDEEIKRLYADQPKPHTNESLRSYGEKTRPLLEHKEKFCVRIKELTGVNAGSWFWQPGFEEMKKRELELQGKLK